MVSRVPGTSEAGGGVWEAGEADVVAIAGMADGDF